MDDVDVLTLVIQEMSKEFPTLMETLVHERDRWVSFGFIYVLKLSAFMSKDDPISFFFSASDFMRDRKKNWSYCE